MSVVVENIKRILTENGFKKQAVARRAGFTAQQFSDILAERKVIKADYIVPLCDALHCTPNDLLIKTVVEG
jgi:DNA-binding Xre family transcriptional regulator